MSETVRSGRRFVGSVESFIEQRVRNSRVVLILARNVRPESIQRWKLGNIRTEFSTFCNEMGEHTITKKKKKQQKKKKDKAKERLEAEMVREDEIEVNGDDEGLSKNEEEAQVNEEHDEYADDADEVAKIAEEEDNPLPSSPQPSPTIPTSESRLPFTSFPLSSLTLRALSSLSLTDTTPIQSACLPPLLAGQDLLGAAPTGSGKTLAFLLPSIELLHRLKFKPANGTGVIVISPTRELALQIFGVARDLLREGGFSQTVGVLMGGANRRAEEEKLCKGVALVVATPGRLWDHLRVS